LIGIFGLLFMIALGVFFWRAAEYEDLSYPYVWPALSVALFLLTPGLLLALGVQVLLFAGMGVTIYLTKWR
jgi:hypothetical protein